MRVGCPSSSCVVCCHRGLTLTRGVVERPVLILRCVDCRFRGSRRRRQRTHRSQNSQKHKVQKHNKHYNPEGVNSHRLGSNPKKGTETCTNTKQHMQRMQPSTKKRQGYISWGLTRTVTPVESYLGPVHQYQLSVLEPHVRSEVVWGSEEMQFSEDSWLLLPVTQPHLSPTHTHMQTIQAHLRKAVIICAVSLWATRSFFFWFVWIFIITFGRKLFISVWNDAGNPAC